MHSTTKKNPFGPRLEGGRLKHIGATATLMSETGVEAYTLPQSEHHAAVPSAMAAVENKKPAK